VNHIPPVSTPRTKHLAKYCAKASLTVFSFSNGPFSRFLSITRVSTPKYSSPAPCDALVNISSNLWSKRDAPDDEKSSTGTVKTFSSQSQPEVVPYLPYRRSGTESHRTTAHHEVGATSSTKIAMRSDAASRYSCFSKSSWNRAYLTANTRR